MRQELASFYQNSIDNYNIKSRPSRRVDSLLNTEKQLRLDQVEYDEASAFALLNSIRTNG